MASLSQEQSGKSSIPNRWRYSFNETCPVRSLASWATSFLLVMVLYILELSLTLHLAVIFLSIFESALLFLQDVFQSVLVACLIQLDLDVLRGGCCVVGMLGLIPFDKAASFAALSALSLPSMSKCPGIQTISVVMPFSMVSFSSLSMTLHSIVCPDCLSGLVVALMAAWLSVYIRHFGNIWEALYAISVARSIALHSAV